MEPEIQQYQEKLIARWKQAFEELSLLPTFEARVVNWEYANSERYPLGKYELGKIPTGGKMLTSGEPASGLFCYGKDNTGRLIFFKMSRSDGRSSWAGIFNYHHDWIEYVEYCIETKTPSRIEQIWLSSGKKKSYLSLILNGRGSYPVFIGKAKEQIIEQALGDGHTVLLNIRAYEYQNRAITKAIGVNGYMGKELIPSDWEMDMGEEAKLMIASGADKGKVKEWEKAGWF